MTFPLCSLLQLILRCINPSRSAYLSLTFHASCFDAYDVFRSEVVQAGVLMKVSAGAAVLVVSLYSMNPAQHS